MFVRYSISLYNMNPLDPVWFDWVEEVENEIPTKKKIVFLSDLRMWIPKVLFNFPWVRVTTPLTRVTNRSADVDSEGALQLPLGKGHNPPD